MKNNSLKTISLMQQQPIIFNSLQILFLTIFYLTGNRTNRSTKNIILNCYGGKQRFG